MVYVAATGGHASKNSMSNICLSTDTIPPPPKKREKEKETINKKLAVKANRCLAIFRRQVCKTRSRHFQLMMTSPNFWASNKSTLVATLIA